MVTDFQDKLRKIRESRTRESQEKREASSVADVEHFSRVESRLLRREEIERTIAEYGEKFIAEVPSFTRSKSFFEGKYKIEFSCEDLRIAAEGAVGKFFSRITFLLDIQTETDLIHVRCKKTVFNKDLESTTTTIAVADPEITDFRNFTEEQFFHFADAYFTASPDAPSPVTS